MELDLVVVLGQGPVLERITKTHDNPGGAVLGRPVGQLGGRVLVRVARVGVARLGEVGPVGRDDALDVVVVVGERVGGAVGVERVEHVHDLALVEGALVLSRGRVVPVVGPDGRGRVGHGDPVAGVGPLRDEALVPCLRVPGLVGQRGGVARGVQREVVVAEVAELDRLPVVDLVDGVGVGGGGTVLILGASGDEGHVVGGARQQLLNVLLGQNVVVQHRLEDQRVVGVEGSDPRDIVGANTVLVTLVEGLERQLTHTGDGGAVVVGGVVLTVDEGTAHVDVRGGQAGDPRDVRVVDTRLGDGTDEETTEQGAVDGVVDLGRAERLAHDGDAVGVTAKVGNVLLDPLQGGAVVEHTVVAGGVVAVLGERLGVQVGVGQVAERIVTAVEAHEDDIVLLGHATTVPPGVVAGLVATLVPDDNGQLVAGGVGAGPDVQVEAVLAGALGGRAGARGPEAVGDESLVPWLAGLGSLPAVLVGSGGGEGDTEESSDIALRDTEEGLELGLVGEVLEALDGTVGSLDSLVVQDSMAGGHEGRSQAKGQAEISAGLGRSECHFCSVSQVLLM